MLSKNKIVYSIKFLLLATLVSPLIVDGGVIFPFIFTKVIYFRILVDLAVIFYLVLIYKHREYLPRNNFFVSSGLVFLFLTIVISYFGVDWNFSFFNSHERMDGIFSLVHYFVFSILLITMFNAKDWRIFLRFLFIVSFIVIGRGFYETSILGASRVSSTLGNPIYFGEYSLFLFYFSTLFSFLTQIKWERYISYVLSILALIGIFISGSRGPFLSLLAGFFIFVLIYFFVSKNNQVKLSLITLVIIGLVFIFGGVFFPNNNIINNIPIVNNLSDIKSLENSVSNRVLVSQVAIEAFKERPLGWGFTNFGTAFNINYRAEFLRRGWDDTFFDSAHNYYLDLLVGLGIPGLASFLAICILAVCQVIKKIRRSRRKVFFALFLALLISMMTQLLFSFLHPTFYLWLFMSLALIVYMTKGDQEDQGILNVKVWVLNILIVILLLFSFWSLLYGNIKAYTANRLDDKIRVLIDNQKMTEAMLLVENNLDFLGPMHREIVRDYAKYLVSANITIAQKDEYLALLLKLNDDISNNLEKYNQGNMFDYLFLMRINSTLNTLGEDRSEEIEDIFVRASFINDERQELNFLYFNYLVRSERIDEAMVLMEKSIKDDPDLYYGYWYLARIYLFLGNVNMAYDYYEQAIDRGFQPTLDDQEVVDFILNNTTI